jgi:hypothetical protein
MKSSIYSKELKKNKILQALTVAKDINEASEIAKVSRKTIYAYLKDDEFVEAHRNIKRVQLREISQTIAEGTNKAISTVLNLMENKTMPHVQLQASVKLLEMYLKFIAIEASVNKATFKDNAGDFSISSEPSSL